MNDFTNPIPQKYSIFLTGAECDYFLHVMNCRPERRKAKFEQAIECE